MEEPPSLLCPECGKLYDLEEIHQDCASCLLVTNSMDCCKSDDELREKYKMTIICLMELEIDLEFEDEDFMEKQTKKAQQTCSKCSQSSEISMICVNCAGIKLKKLENGEWIIHEIGSDRKVANDVICTECAVTDHVGHELVEVIGIRNFTDAIKQEFFLEFYYHRMSILQEYSPNIEKHKGRVDCLYSSLTEGYQEEDFYFCSTELINSYCEERKKLTDFILKVLKVIMRLKMMYIDGLQKHIDHQEILHKDATTNEQKEVIQRLLLRLSLTRIKFEECIQEYPKVQLTPGDIKEIDVELNARMETLEADYKNGLKNEIKLENGSKFHKYQAILKEEKDIINRFIFLCSEDKERTEENFIQKCFKKIDVIKGPFGQENPEETIKFYQMEIMAARIRKDKELKKFIDNNERVFFMDLMKLKFFPVTPDADPMDAVYNQFFAISEDYNFIADEKRKAGK